MVIGNGNIANVLKNKWFEPTLNFVFFASGVSNSKTKNNTLFQREKELLLSQPKHKQLVYFTNNGKPFEQDKIPYYELGTHSYIRHKQNMEKLIIKIIQKLGLNQ